MMVNLLDGAVTVSPRTKVDLFGLVVEVEVDCFCICQLFREKHSVSIVLPYLIVNTGLVSIAWISTYSSCCSPFSSQTATAKPMGYITQPQTISGVPIRKPVKKKSRLCALQLQCVRPETRRVSAHIGSRWRRSIGQYGSFWFMKTATRRSK